MSGACSEKFAMFILIRMSLALGVSRRPSRCASSPKLSINTFTAACICCSVASATCNRSKSFILLH